MSNPVDTLVIRKLIEQVGCPISATTVWVSDYQNIDIEGCSNRIASIREWARSLEDHEVRRAYIKWLDHYDRGINEARREMQTRRMKTDHDKYLSERKREEDDLKKCDKIIPDPPAVH